MLAVFQHTAARRRLGPFEATICPFVTFQHTAARRRLGHEYPGRDDPYVVSTHSRPKAAGESFWDALIITKWFQHTAARRRLGSAVWTQRCKQLFQHTAARRRLVLAVVIGLRRNCFNTQPPEGGWILADAKEYVEKGVSTHSRPKAAG